MTETKKITFEGRSYTVPVWVEWVARDNEGFIYAYDVRRCDTFYLADNALRRIGRDSLTKV